MKEKGWPKLLKFRESNAAERIPQRITDNRHP